MLHRILCEGERYKIYYIILDQTKLVFPKLNSQTTKFKSYDIDKDILFYYFYVNNDIYCERIIAARPDYLYREEDYFEYELMSADATESEISKYCEKFTANIFLNKEYIEYEGMNYICSTEFLFEPMRTHFYNIKENIDIYTGLYMRKTNIDAQLEIEGKYFSIWFKLKERTTDLPKPAQFIPYCKRNDYLCWNNHKYRIMTMNYKRNNGDLKKYRLVKYREAKPTEFEQTISIIYDCETCVIENKHQPYMLYAVVKYPYSLTVDAEPESFLYVEKDITKESSAGEEFVLWMRNEILSPLYEMTDRYRFRVEITGFNNFRFDDTFILDALRTIPGIRGSFNARFGKVSNEELVLNNITIAICDLSKWIPNMSLKKACIDYEINASKMDIDIVTYNNDSVTNGGLIEEVSTLNELKKYVAGDGKNPRNMMLLQKKYKKENGKFNVLEMITDYCIKDVETTADLYESIKTNMVHIMKQCKLAGYTTQHNAFMKYWSVPQFAMDIFKKMLKKHGSRKIVFDPKQARFIYNSYFGGRTIMSMIGQYEAVGELIYQDITSMYAMAMNKSPFPEPCEDSVEIDVDIEVYQKIIDDLIEKRKEAKLNKDLFNFKPYLTLNSFIGFFRCDIFPPDEGDLIAFGPVPLKVAINDGDITQLTFPNTIQRDRILNTIHFKTLIMSGWKIKLISDNCNIVFHKTRDIFTEYMEFLGTMKTQARLDENKTLAKLLKNFLTTIYGKHAQKPVNSMHKQTIYKNEDYVILKNERYKEENWNSSLHYISSCICAYANDILFTTMYKLQQTNIYLDKPLSYKVGALNYCDTDSIVYDSGLCDNIVFEQNEVIGWFLPEENDFYVTWKRKYGDQKVCGIIIIAKKVYFVLVSDGHGGYKMICKKIKGVHTEQIDQFSFDDLKTMLDTNVGKEIQFKALLRVSAKLPDYVNINSNSDKDFIKMITEGTLKKTLTAEKKYVKEECTNEIVYLKNKDFLEKNLYKNNIKHFLVFIKH